PDRAAGGGAGTRHRPFRATGVPGRGRAQPQALGRMADRCLRLEGPSRRRCGRIGAARAGAGQPRRGDRRAVARTGAAHRGVGRGPFRGGARTGAADRRRPLVSGVLSRWWPDSVYGRAALLMLGSTLSFAMMALAIRLATATVPTTEIAFFRNLFGLIVLMPFILRRGTGLPRTRHVGLYPARTAIGLAALLCGSGGV